MNAGRRGTRAESAARHALMVRLHAEGLQNWAIAERLAVTSSAVSRVLKKRGLSAHLSEGRQRTSDGSTRYF